MPPSQAGGLLAILALGLALAAVNSPLAWLYDLVHHTPIGLRIGVLVVERPLIAWINEGLMVFFFLLVTLEIKREFLEGRLATRALAAFPVAAAAGGMAVPAAVYTAINWSDPVALRGWAMPTATDIVLALAVLSLLGPTVQVAQRVFLTALAVLDDVGGIAIIATFYADDLVLPLLLVAGLAAAAVLTLGVFNVQRLSAYGAAGALLWLAVIDSGVNATIAGVIVGAAVPLRAANGQRSPLRALEARLHRLVALIIVPLFVFFNAGLRLADVNGQMLFSPIGFGLVLALVVGKPLGIFGAAWAAVRLGLAQRPPSLSWPQVGTIALLGGIGFTVSLFLASLAFSGSEVAGTAKLGILVGSSIAAAFAVAFNALWPRWARASGEREAES